MTSSPFVILYVEDNALVRESFAELLETTGRRIVSVADAAGARQALHAQHVDLLITDIELPDGSGLDVAREGLARDPALPVILCSGHDVRDAARTLGTTAHALRKPIDPDEVEALIERIAPR